MGSALSTGSIVILATVLLVIMAILVVIALDKVNKITSLTTNSNIKAAHDKLVWAQVTAWIAAGLSLLLTLGYVALHFLETSEWLHLILWILTFASLIISIVLLAIVLGDISNANVSNNQGSTSYIWAALIFGIVAFVVLMISGGWRIATKQVENAPPDQYWMAQDATQYQYQNEPAPPSLNEPAQYPVNNGASNQNNQIQVTTTPNQYSSGQNQMGQYSNVPSYGSTQNYAGTVAAQI